MEWILCVTMCNIFQVFEVSSRSASEPMYPGSSIVLWCIFIPSSELHFSPISQTLLPSRISSSLAFEPPEDGMSFCKSVERERRCAWTGHVLPLHRYTCQHHATRLIDKDRSMVNGRPHKGQNISVYKTYIIAYFIMLYSITTTFWELYVVINYFVIPNCTFMLYYMMLWWYITAYWLYNVVTPCSKEV